MTDWLTDIEQRAAALRERDDGLVLAALLHDDVPRLLEVARAAAALEASVQLALRFTLVGRPDLGIPTTTQETWNVPGEQLAALREALRGAGAEG